MYIIVAGGGKVGYHLARALMDSGHELLVIEQDAAKCERIADDLGDIVVHGDACEVSLLADAGTSRAQIFIAVTGGDEDNLVSCQVAMHKFGVPRAIARINNPKNEAVFRALGIDSTVNVTDAVLAQIEQRLPSHPLIQLLTFRGGGLEIVELQVPGDAAVVGQRLRDVLLPPQSLVTLVLHDGGEPEVPSAETTIRAGDELVAVTLRENEDALRVALTGAVAARPH